MIKDYSLKAVIFNNKFIFIYFSLILLSFCPLEMFIGVLGILFDYISVALSITMIAMYIINGKFSKFTVTISIFCLSLFFSTSISEEASLLYAFKIFYRILAIVYFIDWAMRYNIKGVVKNLYYVLYILIIINFITIIFWPEGLYEGKYKNNWFLGYDNVHIFWYIPTLLLALTNLNIKNKKISIDVIILFAAITYSVYYCFSANSVTAYSIFLIYLIFSKILNKFNLINGKNVFRLFILLFLLIVVFRIQNIFSWLIVDILHKDLTFTHRTIIWDNSWEYIKENWLLGYGIEDSYIMALKLGKTNFAHAHNTLLDVLYKGGIVAESIFIYLLYISIEKLYKNRKQNLSKVYSIATLSVFIMIIFESRQETIGFYLIFILIYNIGNIIEEIKKERIE